MKMYFSLLIVPVVLGHPAAGHPMEVAFNKGQCISCRQLLGKLLSRELSTTLVGAFQVGSVGEFHSTL